MHIASIGIDIGKTTFHLVALDVHGAVVVRQRSEIVQQFDNGWVTEIHLDLIKEARPKLNSGVFGCGLYFANLPSKTGDAVECLGKELARV